MSENPFAQRYKTYSVSQLVGILENKRNYQYPAVAAAQAELTLRNVSEEELAQVRQQLQAEKKEALRKKEEAQQKINTVKSKGAELAKDVLIKPVTHAPSWTAKVIRAICLVHGALFLLDLFDQMDLLRFMFTDVYAKWDLEALAIFIPFLVPPVAFVLLWTRKKAGWLLFAFYLSTGVLLFLSVPMLFPGSSLRLLSVLFNGTTLVLLCTPKIRADYRISLQVMIATVAAPVVLMIVIWNSFF